MGEKGYKAFGKGLVCKGKQYAENTVFEEPKAVPCECGMHYCKTPLDVLDYYPLIDKNGNLTEFATVEPLAEEKTDDGKKYCTTKLKVCAKLSILDFIKLSAEVLHEKITHDCKGSINNTESAGNGARLAAGNRAQLAAGNRAQLAAGDRAQLAAGDWAQLAAGDWAKLAAGNRAQLAAGDDAKLAAGDCAQLAAGDDAKLAAGDWAKLAAGNRAQLAAGDDAKLAAGENSVMVGDHGSIAKARKGSVIVLVERDSDCNIISFKAEQVDGERIKEDTWYKLENGEFVEVNNE